MYQRKADKQMFVCHRKRTIEYPVKFIRYIEVFVFLNSDAKLPMKCFTSINDFSAKKKDENQLANTYFLQNRISNLTKINR